MTDTGNTSYMKQLLTDALRKAISDALEAGESFRGLEQASGVLRQSLMKFVRGETSLRLDFADRLAAHFGMEVKTPKPPKRK